MRLIELASGKSVWRGYDYYKKKRVGKIKKLSSIEYESIVNNGDGKDYIVQINTIKPRSSKCNCPHAKGRMIVCKHMVATYFTVFPENAKRFIEEVENYEREEEKRQEEYIQHRYQELERFIDELSIEEIKERLLNYMIYDEL